MADSGGCYQTMAQHSLDTSKTCFSAPICLHGPRYSLWRSSLVRAAGLQARVLPGCLAWRKKSDAQQTTVHPLINLDPETRLHETPNDLDPETRLHETLFRLTRDSTSSSCRRAQNICFSWTAHAHNACFCVSHTALSVPRELVEDRADQLCQLNRPP